MNVLVAQLAHAKAKIEKAQDYARDLNSQFGSVPAQLCAIERRIEEIEQELKCLPADPRFRKSLVATVLTGSRLTSKGAKRTVELRKELLALQDRQREFQREQSQLAAANESVRRAHEWAAKLERALSMKQRKKASLEELKAAAASNAAGQRAMAASIKRQLALDPFCPYCGCSIDEAPAPHADHIYPVAKGGRSVSRNMVWVCSECNTKKRDLTLATFVRKFGLDRDQIEKRLIALGKDT